MVDRELVSFIREGINKGYSFDVLKPVLKEKGWDDSDIERAFEKATQNQIFIGASIAFVFFIILTAVFIFSLIFSQTQISQMPITTGSIGTRQNIAGMTIAFAIYIIFASLIWLRMIYTFVNRKNRI
jgi:hypothetical protein